MQAFVSTLSQNGGKIAVQLDDGRHLTRCTVSHNLHCSLLGLSPTSTSANALRRAFSNKNAMSKVGELLATYSGMFELCHGGSGGGGGARGAAQGEIFIESFHPVEAQDAEELKRFYRRLGRKRKKSGP